MSRYDKYEPDGGGFRAPLAAAVLLADGFRAYGVGLDTSGRVVLGAGNTGVIGVMIAHGAKAVGDIVDVMTDGEIAEYTLTAGGATTAGTVQTANTVTGLITATAASGTQIPVGYTQALTRLICRVAR
jgi:hypothetical protein